MSTARLLLTLVCPLALAACHFDPSGIGLQSDGAPPDDDAGRQPDAAPADAAPLVPWYNQDWGVRWPIVIHADRVSAPGDALAQYPLLVDLDGLGLMARPDGFDFVFTAADGVQTLDHEIERWDAVGDHLVAWVAIPSLSSTENTTIYLYSDNPDATDQSAATAVWGSGFRGVWHMAEQPNNTLLDDIHDSTQSAYHLTTFFMEDTDLEDARIGQGLHFDGNSEYADTGQDIGISGNDPFTMEAWVLPGDNTQDSYGRCISAWGNGNSQSRGNFLYYHSDEQAFEVGFWANDDQTPGNYPKNTWYHVVDSYDGTTQRVYVNGQEALSRTPGTLDLYNDWYVVGTDSFGQSRYFSGIIDEVRLSNVARSAEWIATTYNNHSDPTSFYTAGPAEQRP